MEQKVRDVVYTGSLRKKEKHETILNTENMRIASRLVNAKPTMEYSNLSEHI